MQKKKKSDLHFKVSCPKCGRESTLMNKDTNYLSAYYDECEWNSYYTVWLTCAACGFEEEFEC